MKAIPDWWDTESHNDDRWDTEAHNDDWDTESHNDDWWDTESHSGTTDLDETQSLSHWYTALIIETQSLGLMTTILNWWDTKSHHAAVN